MVLYERIVDCCGCGACMNACPKDAIIMKSDKYGFIYPHINLQKCIECGLCVKSCRFINSETSAPQKVYAAANQNYNEIMNSASGGVFTAVAREFLKSGGVVFGATLSFDNGHANPHHIQIESVDDLWKLQGSKYVHSEIEFTYSHARIALQAGKKVLFSGTPCQIAGLKSYLKKDYNGLYTIDLICHGVPSGQFFDDYIQHKTHHIGATIKSFNFRDKHLGWG